MRRFFVCSDHSGDIERLLEETGITVQVDLHVQTIISFLEAEGDETTATPLKPLKQSGKLRIGMKKRDSIRKRSERVAENIDTPSLEGERRMDK